MHSAFRVIALVVIVALSSGASTTNAPQSVYFVQFGGPVQTKARDQIALRGGHILDARKPFTYLVRADVNALGSLTRIPGVKRVRAWQLSDRRVPDPIPARAWILFFPDVDIQARATALRALGVSVDKIIDKPRLRFVAANIPVAAISALLTWPDIMAIDPITEFRAHNTEAVPTVQSGSWAAGTMNHTIHNAGIDGTGEIVTVMDSGLDRDHAHFVDTASTIGTPGAGHRKVHSNLPYCANAGTCDDLPCASLDHGTHVSGTVAGASPSGHDQSFDGVAPGARLNMQDIKDGSTCADTSLDPPVLSTDAFPDARASGSFIHTNSWSNLLAVYDSYTQDIDTDLWDNKDFFVLFSAGNAADGATGPVFRTVGNPSGAKNVVTVGAYDAVPNTDDKAVFSSMGWSDTTAQRRKPTLMGPGVDTAGTTDTGANSQGIASASSDGETATIHDSSVAFAGTSMATPATAGAAALVRQYFRDGYYPDGLTGGTGITPSAALIKAVLMNSTRDMNGKGQASPSNQQGWGRVVLDDALYLCGDPDRLFVHDNTTGVTTGGSTTYTVEVTGDNTFVAALAWTDNANVTGELVNDLDLTVTNGTLTWRGSVFYDGLSVTGGSFDRTNNDEMVRIERPVPGTYTVTVAGFNIMDGEMPGNLQPYGLALRGQISSVDGTALGGPPQPPTATRPMDASRAADDTPLLVVEVNDAEADMMNVEFEWDTDPDFGAPTTMLVTGPFADGTFVSHQIAGALANGVHFWRARAIDPSGANCFSPWSDRFSYTVDTSRTGALEGWYQEHDLQFTKSTLVGTVASGSISLALSTNDALGAATSSTTPLGGSLTCHPSGGAGSCDSDNVVDGEPAFSWESLNNVPEHVIVDLGASQSVDRVVLDFSDSYDGNTPSDFTVNTSTNGNCVNNVGFGGNTIHTETNGTAHRYVIDVATVTARCIRLNMTDQIGPGTWVRVGEIEIYAFQTGTAFSQPLVLAELRASGEAWNEFNFTHSTPGTSTITYFIQYDDGSSFIDVLDGVLAGNGAGFTTSPISLTPLNTDLATYHTLRVRAVLTPGSSPSITNWGMEFLGQALSTRITNLRANPVAGGMEIAWQLQSPGDVASIRVQRGPEWNTFAVPADPPPFSALPGQDYTVVDAHGVPTTGYRLEVELTDGTQEYYGPVFAERDTERGCACRVTPRQPLRWGGWLIAIPLIFCLYRRRTAI